MYIALIPPPRAFFCCQYKSQGSLYNGATIEEEHLTLFELPNNCDEKCGVSRSRCSDKILPNPEAPRAVPIILDHDSVSKCWPTSQSADLPGPQNNLMESLISHQSSFDRQYVLKMSRVRHPQPCVAGRVSCWSGTRSSRRVVDSRGLIHVGLSWRARTVQGCNQDPRGFKLRTSKDACDTISFVDQGTPGTRYEHLKGLLCFIIYGSKFNTLARKDATKISAYK